MIILAVPNKTKDARFADLGKPNRIWAVPAIHGEVDRLISIHDSILEHITPGDRLIYLGNYTGYGEHARETVDELLTFRRLVLSMRGMMCKDLVYLRGGQEEMWQKLLQLPFAPDPTSVLLWMLGNGLSSTLYSYGISPHDGIEACRNGVMSITKWTATIRAAIRQNPGHEIFGTQLVRATYTAQDTAYPMLFVHAGLNSQKPLEQQGDHFWWAGDQFKRIERAYDPFQKVIRGYDPYHNGIVTNCITATIDNGCGFGGTLACVGFEQNGDIVDVLEA